MPEPRLILASTSIYRRELLQRLNLPFECMAPGVDETPQPREAPLALAARLARAKAEAISRHAPEAIVIGSDQVAEIDGAALGKPGDHARACAQLRACSGRSVRFHTAVCLRRGSPLRVSEHVDLTEVMFRRLDDAAIERYLRIDAPYDCAGSFRSEAFGAVLFDAVRSEDPGALIGLPLIAVARLLRGFGISLP